MRVYIAGAQLWLSNVSGFSRSAGIPSRMRQDEDVHVKSRGRNS